MFICELQAHLTFSDSAITNYDESFLRLVHLQWVGLGPNAAVQLFKNVFAASEKRVGNLWNNPMDIT